jgi:hypothetical protein
MNRSLIISVISFVLFLLFQVLLFKKLVLFNTAFCFLYIAFILLLPVETKPLLLMLAAFGLGLLTDMFYDHAGMHAAASVAVAYLRNYWLGAITPQGGYDVGVAPTVANNGLIWFLSYALPLITVHHIILFFIEAGGFGYFGLSLGKALASVLFTSVVLIMQQYLFYVKAR